MRLKVTLDTNCFFDYFERTRKHVEDLINHAEMGNIELAMTTRVLSDTRDKWCGKGESPIWNKIQSFPSIGTIGTAFRLDVSYLDSGDFLISEDDSKMISDLSELMKGAQIEDIDHISVHIIGKRDIFVTGDSHFLDHHEELLKKFGALVLRPEDAVKEVEKRLQHRKNNLGLH
jgi:hypothetical protein